MRLNLNLDDELVKKIDAYAANNYINRTSAISVLLSKSLQQEDIQKAHVSIGRMADIMERAVSAEEE